ncbi:type I restriction endonuclease [Thermovirga sp.]|uniref:type I restriction endonuclease n=1 Tax=Thermovirga sp. TaxID=2699834 RepID=UPI00345975DB|nr:hypothetical protein [Thermovirga sp.]
MKNEAFHRLLTEGVRVTYRKDGEEKRDIVKLIDFGNPEDNDFLACFLQDRNLLFTTKTSD